MESRLARNVNRNVATEGRDAGEVNGGPARGPLRLPAFNDGRSESGWEGGRGRRKDEPLFFTSYFASVTTLQAVRRSWPVYLVEAPRAAGVWAVRGACVRRTVQACWCVSCARAGAPRAGAAPDDATEPTGPTRLPQKN